MSKQTKSAARPKPTASTVESGISRCPKCDSTERTPYSGTTTIARAIAGEHNGVAYTHVVWRRTACTNCGQHRKDKTFENRKRGSDK